MAGAAADQAQVPIEELNLPVRSFNSLRREGVHTVGALTGRTEKELLAIDGLGPQSIKEIKGKLADRGLALTAPGVTPEEAAVDASGAATAGSRSAKGSTTAGSTTAGSAATGSTTAGSAATGSAATASAAAGPATTGSSTAGSAATGTGGPRPAAASPGPRAGAWDAGAPPADRPAANGLLPPRTARPQDEDALDLLSVAGLPLLKRFAPVLGFLVFAGVLVRIVRRRRRTSRA